MKEPQRVDTNKIGEELPSPASVPKQGKDRGIYLAMAVLAVVVLAVVIIRFKAAPLPLERDEGEYALMGQLILDGVPPYQTAANMKLPGTYYAYSVIMAVFGQTITAIHLGLLVIHLLSTAILYMIALPLLGYTGAVLAAAAFMVMSLDYSVLGLFAHATHFVMLFALAGVWILQKSENSGREIPLLLGSGLCLGLGVIMKQSGALFALFGLVWSLYDSRCRRPVSWKRALLRFGTLTCGIVIPYVVVLALVYNYGVFDRFWFWTVEYARAYAGLTDIKEGFQHFRSHMADIISINPWVWGMALGGLITVSRTEPGRRVAPFLLSFSLFSLLAVCPGFYFRPHYFVQLLPAAALFAGSAPVTAAALAARYTNRTKALQLAILVVVAALSLNRPYFIGRALSNLTPERISHKVYGIDPFPESVNIGEYLARNTNPEDRIAILGSEPQIWFYSHRRPASEYIYVYALMEQQPYAPRMQEEFIREVEKSNPPFLVHVLGRAGWNRHQYTEKKLFDWMTDFIWSHYKPVLAAHIHSDHTDWLVGKEAETFDLRPDWNKVVVYKRKEQ
jgi:hypothetical protein